MSVTNDPNYHEGQPVFQNAAKGGAYQPTSDHLDRMNPPQGSETGARCPWCGSEMILMLGPFMRTSQGNWHRASCRNNECLAQGPMVLDDQNNFKEAEEAALAAASRNEQLGPRMPWSDMSGSEKEAVYNTAARPLPDFPAEFPECAHGPWRKGNHANLLDASGGFLFSIPRHPNSADGLIIRNFILSRVNAPARPAAAGLTLTDEEREECEIAGHDAASDARKRYQIVMTNQYVECECVGLAAAIRHAESILSSRATGAEVEIQAAPSHDETSRDVDAWLVEFQKGADTPVTATMIHLLHVGYAMGWKKCARRHATIRRGGGE